MTNFLALAPIQLKQYICGEIYLKYIFNSLLIDMILNDSEYYETEINNLVNNVKTRLTKNDKYLKN